MASLSLAPVAQIIHNKRSLLPEERKNLTQVLPDDERLSKWTLMTNQFGRDWEFSWISQNMTPIRQQKIHWRSVQVRALATASMRDRCVLLKSCSDLLRTFTYLPEGPFNYLQKGGYQLPSQRWLTGNHCRSSFGIISAGVQWRQPGRQHRHCQPRADQILPQGHRVVHGQTHHLL